jgi:hypothetical protein
MVIERSGFLLMAGALATGGVVGWLVNENDIGQPPRAVVLAEPAPTPPVTARIEPSGVVVVDSHAAPTTCDDSIGAAEECPSVGPADEGLCGNRIAKRCSDFKESLKPRVAQEAVACLNRLKGNERCDMERINLCGHAALMAACPEAVDAATGTYLVSTATKPASFTLDRSTKPPSPLSGVCKSMAESCANQPSSPTIADCRQTLTGMNDAGRARTLACVASHCQDRGLLGCEAAPVEAPPLNAASQR